MGWHHLVLVPNSRERCERRDMGGLVILLDVYKIIEDSAYNFL